MDIQRIISERQSVVVTAAAAAPLLLCAVLATLRGSVPSVSAALGLVVLVVAAAATGIRAAGLAAAASSALWFDVLLTEPRGQLAMTSPADIEATVLLITVGIAVSELALWGRRQQAKASQTTGYLAGLLDTASMLTGTATGPAELTHSVAQRITDVLRIDRCRYVPGQPGYTLDPILGSDGVVVRAGRTIDVGRDGLPVDCEIVLPVRNGGRLVGHFLLTAATRVVRPSPDQLRVAVLLADQVGSVLSHA
jgi:K+-sensing histidine kinase KdpD